MPPQFLFDLSTIDLNRILFDREKIRLVNPQRGQMEHLDAIVHVNESTEEIIGYKDVRDDEFWVDGHIPGRPLLPGVIMIESGALSLFLHAHGSQMDRFHRIRRRGRLQIPPAGGPRTKALHPRQTDLGTASTHGVEGTGGRGWSGNGVRGDDHRSTHCEMVGLFGGRAIKRRVQWYAMAFRHAAQVRPLNVVVVLFAMVARSRPPYSMCILMPRFAINPPAGDLCSISFEEPPKSRRIRSQRETIFLPIRNRFWSGRQESRGRGNGGCG